MVALAPLALESAALVSNPLKFWKPKPKWSLCFQSLLDVDQRHQKTAPTLIQPQHQLLDLAVPQFANATQTFANLGWISYNLSSLVLLQWPILKLQPWMATLIQMEILNLQRLHSAWQTHLQYLIKIPYPWFVEPTPANMVLRGGFSTIFVSLRNKIVEKIHFTLLWKWHISHQSSPLTKLILFFAVYFDAESECHDLDFQLGEKPFGVSALASRSWSIKLSQYSCDYTNLAPSGCDQYYYGSQAINQVQTFNYDGGKHLANQRQTICVRYFHHFRDIWEFPSL